MKVIVAPDEAELPVSISLTGAEANALVTMVYIDKMVGQYKPKDSAKDALVEKVLFALGPIFKVRGYKGSFE